MIIIITYNDLTTKFIIGINTNKKIKYFKTILLVFMIIQFTKKFMLLLYLFVTQQT